MSLFDFLSDTSYEVSGSESDAYEIEESSTTSLKTVGISACIAAVLGAAYSTFCIIPAYYSSFLEESTPSMFANSVPDSLKPAEATVLNILEYINADHDEMGAVIAASPIWGPAPFIYSSLGVGGVIIIIIIVGDDAVPYNKVENRAGKIYNSLNKKQRKKKQSFPTVVSQSEKVFGEFSKLYGKSNISCLDNLDIIETALKNKKEIGKIV